MCNETVTAIKITIFFQRFSTGFDVLKTNTSPLDPVDPVVDPEGVDYVGLSLGLDGHIVHTIANTRQSN